MKRNLFFATFLLCALTIQGCGEGQTAENSNKPSLIDQIALPDVPQTLPVNVQEDINDEPSYEEQQQYDDVLNLYQNGFIEEALSNYQNFILDHPDSDLADEAQKGIGDCYSDLEQPEQALEAYAKVIIDYPQSSSVCSSYYNIAYIYRVELNEPDTAIPYYILCLNNVHQSDSLIMNRSIKVLEELTDIVITTASSDSTDDINTLETNGATDSTDSAEDLYDHISNADYAEMLNTYNDIFMNEMSVIRTNQLSSLMEQNVNVSTFMVEINQVLEQLDVSEQNLQDYFNEFDKDRTKAPMGTRIMTMLSDAQSATTRYKIAIQHLKDYILTQEQKCMEDFDVYIQKSKESMESYNNTYKEEKSKLGIE